MCCRYPKECSLEIFLSSDHRRLVIVMEAVHHGCCWCSDDGYGIVVVGSVEEHLVVVAGVAAAALRLAVVFVAVAEFHHEAVRFEVDHNQRSSK